MGDARLGLGHVVSASVRGDGGYVRLTFIVTEHCAVVKACVARWQDVMFAL